MLVENVKEELDPSLEPLLLQQVVKIKGQMSIKLGDNNVPYNDQFRLYLCTKLPNPHYTPELQVKVTLLNFTITPGGLEDQMLSVVVARESPETETKKNKLVVENAQRKKTLQDIEDAILSKLSSTQGSILDDEDLINTLAVSKKTSTEVNEQLAVAEEIEKEIDQARTAYIPVARRASILFFCIADLSLIDPMYQYSLQWFINLFVSSVAQAPQSDDILQRLQNLNAFFTKSLFENVCRSLFEIHKQLFAFLLTVRIMQGDSAIRLDEWRFLVAGAPPTKQIKNPAPQWLTEDVWNQLLALSDLDNFRDFDTDFIGSLRQWQRYFESPEPHSELLPAPWQDKLDDFQKLLVLKCLRSDKMFPAIANFVTTHMGPEFNEAPQFNLALSYKDSNNLTPLIFVLSRGADPASKLFQFSNEMGYRDKISSVSLGQGQGDLAKRFIEEAARKGGWVLLQNCHLATSWLPKLEQICQEMKPEEVHEDFRLWLTSLPTPQFPVSLLQNGVKMTNEPPKGLKANLQGTWTSLTEAEINRCKKPEAFKKLLFALTFFHAVILERRKFGALGWNIPYEFTENDLAVCVTQLRDFIDMYEDIPYRVIHFLTYDTNYGGRVTDDVDRRTICTILDDFINPAVLEDGYKFSPSGKYITITSGKRDEYLKYISALDNFAEPEVFGLHSNADITSAQEETASMLQTILALLPRATGGSGKTREETISETSLSILGRVPPVWDVETVMKKYPTTYEESMNTVLVQEVIRYNTLLATIKQSLKHLVRALKGEMVMTEAMDKMADSLFTNSVPELWDAVAYPSLMPLAAWVNDLLARCAFINKWVQSGIPNVFWISGFFFPQAFLTGTLQNYARRHRKPIDAVSFGFKMDGRKPEAITARPADGVYITGLYLEGARWDPTAHSLVDSRARELYTAFPVMHLLPEVERKATLDGVYKCPVYKILTRRGVLMTTGHSTNFVLFVEIPTQEKAAKWIKAGVALFCGLRY